MSFDQKQFRDLIERVLEAAVNTYLRQVGGGPALGVFQMEPATGTDTWINYLDYRPVLAREIWAYTGQSGQSKRALESNLAYQIAMARVHYRRVPELRYWKKYYNTLPGAGTVEEFTRSYKRFIEEV
jgi:hypothetical protein